MRIAIFGVGAMGCLFGARLGRVAEVRLIGHWPAQLHELSQARMRLKYPDGKEELFDVTATKDPDQVGPVDVVIIATKSVKTEKAARDAARILKPDGIAVTIQNGLGNLEVLAHHVGAERAVQAVTAQGATVVMPGELRYGGMGLTHIATRPNVAEAVRQLADLFESAGLPVEVTDDVSSLVWGKLAINCAINPLTALLRVPNGVLLESEWARAIMRGASLEVVAVADAQLISLPFNDAASRSEEVAEMTAHNLSSMLQDVIRDTPTEIDAICGAVVRAGQQTGIPTPVNQMLYQMVKALESTYQERVE